MKCLDDCSNGNLLTAIIHFGWSLGIAKEKFMETLQYVDCNQKSPETNAPGLPHQLKVLTKLKLWRNQWESCRISKILWTTSLFS